MPFELQPVLQNSVVRLRPLRADDRDALYQVAADPLIWAQHPNRHRHQRPVFDTFFDGALESGGAFCVYDAAGGALIGSSRFYDWDEAGAVVSIGYTFIARHAWGGAHNRALKTLMLDHAFRFAGRVLFFVGTENRRSRKAMEKLGAQCIGEAAVRYHGEPVNPNVVYQIAKSDWAGSCGSLRMHEQRE